MLKMIINGQAAELIDITSYSRNLDIPDPDVRFRLNLNFSGDYSADGVEYLANYADTLITKIKIQDDSQNVLLYSNNVKAKLESLSETCDANGRYGYATIVIYEATANI